MPENYGTMDAVSTAHEESSAVTSPATSLPTRRHIGRTSSETSMSRSRTSLGIDSRSIVIRAGDYSENDPMIPADQREPSPSEVMDTLSIQDSEVHHRRKSCLWMIPVVLIAGISRGMTMAPRIEVYTQVACEELHPLSNETSESGWLNFTSSSAHREFSSPFTPVHDSSTTISSSYHSKESNSLHEKDNYTVLTPLVECLHDPAVQSRAAAIQATLGTIVGMLSIITAGYWGQISDAFGRKVAMTANLFGLLSHDIVYVLVNKPGTIFSRYAWRFLIIGPVVEGILGGLTTYHAIENAYLADCATSGSRSTIFAYFQGAAYISLASGPQIASIILEFSSADARTTMFNTGLVLEIIVFLYALLILPETVTHETMLAARRSRRESFVHEDGPSGKEKWATKFREGGRRVLAPLSVFAPKRKSNGGWELSMTFLVVAQFTHLMSVGVVQVKFLYAQHTFAWSVKQLGRYISLLWTLRAFHLLLLLPTLLYFIRPKRSTHRPIALSQDLKFDYRIAQASIFIDSAAYILTLLAPSTSEILFVCFTSLSSFTAGVNPAINSLAVSYLFAFHDDENVGRMFGGMSMLQAIAHTLQPLIFGVVYSETAATYPKTIFALAAGLLISSSAMFALLRTDVMPKVDIEETSQSELGYREHADPLVNENDEADRGQGDSDAERLLSNHRAAP